MVEFADLDTPANRRYAYRIALCMGLCHDEAEDIAQDVMIAAYLHGHNLRHPRGWLNQCARNASSSRIHQQARFIPLDALHDQPSDDPTPCDSALRSDRLATVRLTVDTLPSHLRDTIHLLYWESLSNRDTATLLGISRQAVIKRHAVARDELRRRLTGTV